MLTPQNFREKTFERAIFGGYDMGAVDDFLDEAATDYAAVAKENMVLKSKMKVLVDKIEEYRATEDSMRLTLLSVQKLCTQMEQEAKEKAESLLADAQLEVGRITREAYTQRATEEAKLLDAKRASTQYIENMRILSTRQLEFLDGLDSYKLEDGYRTDAPAATSVEDTVRSIESSVERLADAADSDREIGRVVTDGTGAPAGNEEPTRLFSANSAPSGTSFSIDSLHFGK